MSAIVTVRGTAHSVTAPVARRCDVTSWSPARRNAGDCDATSMTASDSSSLR